MAKLKKLCSFFFLHFTEVYPKGINKMLLASFFSVDRVKKIDSFFFVNCSTVNTENPFNIYKASLTQVRCVSRLSIGTN